ncbi:hypothetical protein ABIC07_008387 [Bradyrhizobium sp. RT9a]
MSPGRERSEAIQYLFHETVWIVSSLAFLAMAEQAESGKATTIKMARSISPLERFIF